MKITCTALFALFVVVFSSPCKASGYSQADTVQINKLLADAKRVVLIQPDTSRKLAEKALQLSKRGEYEKGAGISFEIIGISYWAQAYNQISLSYLLNAANYLQKYKLKSDLADTYTFIAKNYADLNNYSVALDYLKKAIALSIRIRDDVRLDKLRNELSLILFAQKDFNKSQSVINQSLRASIQLKKKQEAIEGRLYNRLALIAEGKRDFEKAKKYLDTSNALALRSGDKRLRADNLYSYSSYLYKTGETARALLMADTALVLNESMGDVKSTINVLKFITDIYIKLGNSAAALVYQNRYINLKDSLTNAENVRSADLIQQYLKVNNKELDNEEIEGELSFQKKITIWLGALMSILIAGMLMIAIFYKQKKQLSEELVSQNDAIREQKATIEIQSQNLHELNSLKDKLFAIIGHDLRSPINNLRAMMEMFQTGEMPNEEIAAILKEMLPSVEGADLVISNLLNWAISQMEGLKINKSDFYMYSIAKETEIAFTYLLRDKQITLENNTDPGHMVFADKEHVRIILRNLVSNAVKFTPVNGRIKLSSKINGHQVILAVEDNGQGMSNEEIQNLFINNTHFTKQGTKGEKGAGIGLMLCQEMAGLNNGNISVASKQGESCTFFLTLPKSLKTTS